MQLIKLSVFEDTGDVSTKKGYEKEEKRNNAMFRRKGREGEEITTEWKKAELEFDYVEYEVW